MTKNAQWKRAKHLRACDDTKAFSKDWSRQSGSGRYDMNQLKAVMLLLIANDEALGAEWKDQPLKGEWSAHRMSCRRRFLADL